MATRGHHLFSLPDSPSPWPSSCPNLQVAFQLRRKATLTSCLPLVVERGWWSQEKSVGNRKWAGPHTPVWGAKLCSGPSLCQHSALPVSWDRHNHQRLSTHSGLVYPRSLLCWVSSYTSFKAQFQCYHWDPLSPPASVLPGTSVHGSQ